MKRVLIVEDQKFHLEAAIAAFEGTGIELITARNALEGQSKMRRKKEGSKEWHKEYEAAVDGVITDVFMPLHEAPFDHDNDPCGILVAAEATKLGIPLVLCTAGYHHGLKYEWINQLCMTQNWPLADCSEYKVPQRGQGEAPSKDWQKAIELLQKSASHE